MSTDCKLHQTIGVRSKLPIVSGKEVKLFFPSASLRSFVRLPMESGKFTN